MATIDEALDAGLIDPKAEIWVLGSVLFLPQVLDDLADILTPDDFFDENAQLLYRGMVEIHESGRKVDAKLLERWLEKRGQKLAGDLLILLHESLQVPYASNAVHYAEIVRDKAVARALREASIETLQDVARKEKSATEMIERAEKRLFKIAENGIAANAVPMADCLTEAFAHLDNQRDGTVRTVKTGLTDLDDLLGGFRDGELIILAARPSMGKTALAVNIAEVVSVRYDEPVLFVSLEMARLELAQRMLCSHAQVNARSFRTGILTNSDRERCVESSGVLGLAPLDIDDSPTKTMTQIAASARRHKRRKKTRLVIIDYLQLIHPDSSKEPREQQVASIARRLKGLARELSVPVLCLAQLNRETEKAGGNRPKLSHLRESGAIEQDADVVMFIHREEYYAHPDDLRPGGCRADCKGKATVIVAKQRNGPIGDVNLLWNETYTRFSTPMEEYKPMEEWDG